MAIVLDRRTGVRLAVVPVSLLVRILTPLFVVASFPGVSNAQS